MRRLLSLPLLKPFVKQTLLLFILILLSIGAGTSGAGTSILLAQDANSGAVTADDVNTIARELWCPLCSGVRLDACELKACEQMKDMIAIKLGEGEDLDHIRAYFVEQYGPQVLGEPPREGFSWLAWILPVVAMLGGGLLIWSRMRLMVPPSAQNANGHNPTNHGASSHASSSHESPSDANGMSEQDATKLREELKRYG